MDVDVPNKRALTDEVRDANAASDKFSRSSSSGTPEDLVQRLRNAGARGRKSVLEGYKTSPSTFSKAQSTGSIFRSMNETLQEVYSSRDASANLTNNNQTSRKRARSVSDHDEQTPILEGSEMQAAFEHSATSRPIKPLRTSQRSLHTTRSLPAGEFAFGGHGQSSKIPHFRQTVNEEEDWSQETTFQSSEQHFEPMVL
ncbi:hypothetical protein CVT25_011180 [Psilocybe cyanescens]|uniref:Uncharacterized protein n=1 Tax=Psilocybe cyanescens TaxID=93625 RepID=A0A409WGX8_PSICY|nr:hypothetical protein CVT25_011180 [Psilocybe cyanescens]